MDVSFAVCVNDDFCEVVAAHLESEARHRSTKQREALLQVAAEARKGTLNEQDVVETIAELAGFVTVKRLLRGSEQRITIDDFIDRRLPSTYAHSDFMATLLNEVESITLESTMPTKDHVEDILEVLVALGYVNTK